MRRSLSRLFLCYSEKKNKEAKAGCMGRHLQLKIQAQNLFQNWLDNKDSE